MLFTDECRAPLDGTDGCSRAPLDGTDGCSRAPLDGTVGCSPVTLDGPDGLDRVTLDGPDGWGQYMGPRRIYPSSSSSPSTLRRRRNVLGGHYWRGYSDPFPVPDGVKLTAVAYIDS